jgi:hypothetical protein
VVTDHSDGLGSTKALAEAPRFMLRDPLMRRWHDMLNGGPEQSLKATGELIDAVARRALPAAMMDPEGQAKRTRSIWSKYIDAVERYNQPGKFTALMGFEWTLMDGGKNLHRNVVFRDGRARVGQVVPLGSLGATIPDGLWDYMDAYEAKTGGRALAIPHNSNVSNGLMFR